MKKKDLIEKVKNWYENGECYNIFELEELVEGAELVKESVDIKKHRWYETSISIFKCSDGLLGIRLPSQLYSESSEWSSLYSGIEFYDIEEVMEIAYKTKKNKNMKLELKHLAPYLPYNLKVKYYDKIWKIERLPGLQYFKRWFNLSLLSILILYNWAFYEL